MPPKVQTVFKILITAMALFGIGLFMHGWYVSARDAPAVLTLLIVGILFSTLGFRFPGMKGFDDSTKEEKKDE